MLEIALLAGARDDLDESYNWYESKEIGLGDRFLNYVQDGFLLIRQHPEIFPVLTSNFRRALISKFPFEIIYKIEEKRVVVYSVFNCSQDPQKWKSRVSERRNE
jgi:plasmid stabilization system protein ParE